MSSKKAILVYILKILREETDANHTLSQEEIRTILSETYGINVDRKTLGRHLNDLYESQEFNIECEESTVGIDGSIRRTNFYMIHQFEDSELHLIIDGLLASRHINELQRAELIQKVSKLGSPHFSSNSAHIETSTGFLQRSQDLFLNIDLIENAIGHSKKISLAYYQPDVDKQLHVNLDRDGNERRYIFNPFHLVVNRGQYYLVGNHEHYNDMSTLRVDRIGKVQILDEPRKDIRTINGYKNQRTFDVVQYMKEHIYAFGGESVHVKFEAKRTIVNQILDWFDGNVEFIKVTPDTVECYVTVNKEAFKYWALQYLESVKVLSPTSMVFEVREAIRDGLHQYDV